MSSSDIFGNNFSTPDASRIWSDHTRIAHCLRFEACLALAQADLGIIPNEAAAEIARVCNVDEIDFDQLRRDADKTRNPIVGLVQQIGRRVDSTYPGFRDWINYGAATQDVTDTATVLQLAETLDIVLASILHIDEGLVALAKRHATTRMAARSDLHRDVPTTWGFKLARHLATFRRHTRRLEQLMRRVVVLQFGGPAGTLASLPADKAFACQQALATFLGLHVPEIAWHSERDRICEIGGFFALLTATCAKLATDVRLLMQPEVGELSSSDDTPPQKPSLMCTYITGMATTVRSHAGALYDAMVADHERSTGPLNVELIVLPEMCKLTCATLQHAADLVAGLHAHPDAMDANMRLAVPRATAKAVIGALVNAGMGHATARHLVDGLCERTSHGVPLLELLCADDAVAAAGLGRETLARLCEPDDYLALSVAMVERVCAF